MTLPTFAAERRAAAPLLLAIALGIDRYLLLVWRSAANLPRYGNSGRRTRAVPRC